MHTHRSGQAVLNSCRTLCATDRIFIYTALMARCSGQTIAVKSSSPRGRTMKVGRDTAATFNKCEITLSQTCSRAGSRRWTRSTKLRRSMLFSDCGGVG